MRLLLYLSILVLFFPFVNAVVIVPVDNTDYSLEARSNGMGCAPPMDFAKVKGCQLKYPQKDYTVGRFICGNYIIDTDCQGNIASVVDKTYISEEDKALKKKINYIVIGFFIIGTIFLIIRNKYKG